MASGEDRETEEAEERGQEERGGSAEKESQGIDQSHYHCFLPFLSFPVRIVNRHFW